MFSIEFYVGITLYVYKVKICSNLVDALYAPNQNLGIDS